MPVDPNALDPDAFMAARQSTVVDPAPPAPDPDAFMAARQPAQQQPPPAAPAPVAIPAIDPRSGIAIPQTQAPSAIPRGLVSSPDQAYYPDQGSGPLMRGRQPVPVTDQQRADAAARQHLGVDLQQGLDRNPALRYVADNANPDTLKELGSLATGLGFEAPGLVAGAVDNIAAKRALFGLRTAIGGFFTYQAGKGAGQSLDQAQQAYQRGDYSAMSQHLGIAGTQALLAFLGGKETVERAIPGVAGTAERAAQAEAQKPYSQRNPYTRGPQPEPEVQSGIEVPPQAETSKPSPTSPEPQTIELQPSTLDPDTFMAERQAEKPAPQPEAKPEPPPEPDPAMPVSNIAPPEPAAPQSAPEPVARQEFPDVQIPPEYLGRLDQVKTAAGYKATVQHAIVPQDWITASHDKLLQPNPRFMAGSPENQPRDRSSAASIQQINEMRDTLDPEELKGSPSASTGAPIVDAKLFGLAGHGRSIAIQGLYADQHPNAQLYKQSIEDDARKYGIDGEFQAGDQPMHVRILRSLPAGISPQQFALDSNESHLASMSAPEQAKVDAQRLDPELLAKFVANDEGKIATPANAEFLRGFVSQVVGKAKRNEFMTDDGTVSQSGVNRVRNALFHAAYNDSATSAKLAEDTDTNIKNILGGMLQAAPDFAVQRQQIALGNLHNRDLSADVAAAARKLSALRDAKMTVEHYFDQQSLFGGDLSPIQMDVLKVMNDHARSAKRVGEILKTYAQAVRIAGNPKQESMFGLPEPPSRAEILNAAIARVNELHAKEKDAKLPDLFQNQPAAVASGPPRPAERGAAPAPDAGTREGSPGRGNAGAPAEPAASPPGPRPGLKKTQAAKQRQPRQNTPVRQAKPHERGAATPEFLTAGLSHLLEETGPKGNYSGLGAAKDRFIRNLSQLEEANPKAHTAALAAAGSRGQAAVLLRGAVPKIERTLRAGNGPSWDEFRTALVESRLRGIRQRWNDLAQHAQRAGEQGLARDFEHGLMTLLHAIEGKRDIPQDVYQTALALFQKTGLDQVKAQEEANLFPDATDADRAEHQAAVDELRGFLRQTFTDAANSVERVLSPQDYERITQNAAFPKALEQYKQLIEQPLAQNHEANEGIFSTALGPLQTYYPLIPTGKEESGMPGRRLAYRKPQNIANEFATGISPLGFDTGMTPLAERMNRAIRGNNKAALLQTLKGQGLLRPIRPGDKSQVIPWRGEEYAAARIETKPDRIVVANGKVLHRPAESALIPQWLKAELAPILEEGTAAMPPGRIEKMLSAVNAFALAGPLDLVFHARNLIGTMIANTPFAGTDIFSKTIGNTPVTKLFTSVIHIVNTDPASEEAIRDMSEMARLGLIPDRYGTETFFEAVRRTDWCAPSHAATRPRRDPPQPGPAPVWTERARYPRAPADVPHRQGNQPGGLGAGDVQICVAARRLRPRPGERREKRWLKDTGVDPFATAATTMLRNGVHSVLGSSPLPTSSYGMPHQLKYKLWQQLSGGFVGLAALWVLSHYALTGKLPWDDPKARLLKLPVPNRVRQSAFGHALWGTRGSTAYVDLSFFSPLVGRGARATGIAGAFDAHAKGGKPGQVLEGAERDAMNSFAHPFANGPLVKAGSVLTMGAEPYITGLRDREGNYAPQFMPATNKASGFPSLRDRALESVLSMNGFAGKLGAATGIGHQSGESSGANRWLRMATDLTMPGLVSNAQSPQKQSGAMRAEARAVARHKRGSR